VRQIKGGLSKEHVEGSTHPDLARIRLGEQEVPMIFSNGYWNSLCTSDELLMGQEWRSLRGLLVEFKELALEHDIIPIVLFIPTKLQVYGEFFSVQSGENFMRRIDKQLLFQDNSVEAMRKLTLELNIRLIDLTPGFRRLAEGGELLPKTCVKLVEFILMVEVAECDLAHIQMYLDRDCSLSISKLVGYLFL
jgi:hypothetical protein